MSEEGFGGGMAFKVADSSRFKDPRKYKKLSSTGKNERLFP